NELENEQHSPPLRGGECCLKDHSFIPCMTVPISLIVGKRAAINRTYSAASPQIQYHHAQVYLRPAKAVRSQTEGPFHPVGQDVIDRGGPHDPSAPAARKKRAALP